MQSGSPGYAFGSNLLVKLQEANGYSLYKEGFFLNGRDNSGKCVSDKESAEYSYYSQVDPKIRFGENLTYSCQISMNQLDFMHFCKGKKWTDFMIFSHLGKLDQIGIFGNAQLSNKLVGI